MLKVFINKFYRDLSVEHVTIEIVILVQIVMAEAQALSNFICIVNSPETALLYSFTLKIIPCALLTNACLHLSYALLCTYVHINIISLKGQKKLVKSRKIELCNSQTSAHLQNFQNSLDFSRNCLWL